MASKSLPSFYSTILLFCILFQQSIDGIVSQKISCKNENDNCEELVGKGSICRLDEKGDDDNYYYCSNPYEQGCLYNLLPDWNKKRVCNSDDPANAADLGICRSPDIDDYLEVRIYSENWESISFISWIIQILLSEILGVPTSLETGTPFAKKNFYDPHNAFDYGRAYPMEALALETAAEVGGHCSQVREHNQNLLVSNNTREQIEENYLPCAHLIPEAWDQMFASNLTHLEDDRALGANGQEAWFITKFTAEKYPALATYLGLQGEKNRHQLAKLFLRPTTWLEYCEQVSTNNCTDGGDFTAKRPPQDANEASRMFVDGLYTGHFRKTEENDCDTFPTTCKGHIADYPCGWSSNTEQQAYHLDIALRSSGSSGGGRGYSYTQMVDMWRAANATKSNLMMVWWTPQPLVQSFLGTDAEFHRVTLPQPTQACYNAKVSASDRCDVSEKVRVGDPLGVCDYLPQNLYKRMATGLYDAIYDPSIPNAIRNPAYNALQSFSLTELQLDELFDLWKTKPTPRDAICQWSVDNIDYLEKFVPRNYPRILQKEVSLLDRALQILAIVLGTITVCLVLVTAGAVYQHREDRNIRIAQIEFLWLLLTGLFLISIGSIVNGMERSNITCIVSIWFINTGFTLELVPLIVKVAAINRMAVAAKKMRRVTIDRTSLYKVVAVLFLLVVIYLMFWTLMDPPNKVPEYELSLSNTNSDGDTIVAVSHYCSSHSGLWRYFAVGWICTLLLCATVLAFQMRNLVKDFNESWTLALMIYSHMMFVILRVITFLLSDYVSGSLLQQLQSYIYSLDVIVTVVLYFLPKFLYKGGEDKSTSSFSYASQFSRPALHNNMMQSMQISQYHHGGNPTSRPPSTMEAEDIECNNNKPHRQPSCEYNNNNTSYRKQDQCPASNNNNRCCSYCGAACQRCGEEESKPLVAGDDEKENDNGQ